MDRLQPLRALGSDRGVSPVEVRRREVSEEFGAREGENKGETKGEKSCTQVEKQNQKQNQQIDFHDLDGKSSAALEETNADASNQTTSTTTTQQTEPATTSRAQRRKGEDREARKPPTEGFLSTTKPTEAQANACEETGEGKDASEKGEQRAADRKTTTTQRTGPATTSRAQRRKGEDRAAQPTTTEGFFSTPTPTGAQEDACEEVVDTVGGENTTDTLAITKRLLTDFSLTITAAKPQFFELAKANVSAAFAKQIARHVGMVEGKNAKKKAAAILEDFCAALLAERLAERNAKTHDQRKAHRREEPCGSDSDEGLEEDDGSSAEPEPDDDEHHFDATADYGDTADLAEEWC